MAKARKANRSAVHVALLLAAIAGLLALILMVLPPRKPAGPKEAMAAGEPAARPEEGEAVRPASPREEAAEEEPPPEAPSPTARSAAAAALPGKPARLALVFDDAGHNLEDLQPYLRLPVPLAVAVLPRLPHSAAAAGEVRAAGKELLLHLPMEPLNGEDPGPGAIGTGQSAAEIGALLAEYLAAFPGAAGVNNHMGSRATADERVMGEVMRALQGGGRIFLDSRTTAQSVAEGAAARFGVPFLARDVFLDNAHEPEEIRRALLRGVAIARKKGGAVLIGHVTGPGAAEVLSRMLPALGEEGVRFVRLEELANEPGEKR